MLGRGCGGLLSEAAASHPDERSTLTVPAKSPNIKYVESVPISADRGF